MKILSLATKKLNLIFGQDHEQKEGVFKDIYLHVWYSIIRNTSGLTLQQATEFCYCCEKFGIRILGFETSYESGYGLNTYAYEEYCDEYTEEWWLSALSDLKRKRIVDSLIPYIDIPEIVLQNYIE